ncbi:PREDICTED: sodium-coupled monocarboxylate transporter 2-like [Nicrophorus vespilloides]|uniref:Sodium-coupled monocarboxylate transporter 2-like n=1 Tax=Nicrophorus vespilloides TaxID=110193 RepID=A0ABM1ME41_NICVS|nr:PREDICTED: sodium-coupled monocarboxylate transporter 2-like [Nicrophorus vespilloides]
MENFTDPSMDDDLKFSLMDYSLFGLMLASSAMIGVYFGFFSKKQNTADEYLLGGKDMNVVPIALSLIACNISGITILAVPADVYLYGYQYWLCPISIQICIILLYFVTFPVFYNLKLTSTYEYLKMRFDSKIRTFTSFLYALNVFLYLPIVIYVPALALSQGTGFNIHYITPVVCGVCIFYTTIGGLKAVVWTDALQTVLMIGSTVVVTYLGTVSSGGFNEIMRISDDGGRLDMNFDLDPTLRDTFWTILIGSMFAWAQIISISQGTIQKCLALPSLQSVKKALIILAIGMMVVNLCSIYTGLMMYAKYKDCDPLKSKKITVHDQMLPYYILHVAGKIPGLPGLFIAGVFSAALSSLSASMNSLSCTIYEDFISQHMPKDYPQDRVSYILKWIVFSIGFICTVLVFVVEQLGSIQPLVVSMQGVTAGPMLGLFLMGMMVPMANSKGALYGGVGSILAMAYVIFGSQYHKMNGNVVYETKPVSVEGCLHTFNSTTFAEHEPTEVSFIYRLSFYYYVVLGTFMVFLIGIPVSWFTRDDEPPVHKDLICGVMQWAIPKDKKRPPTYYSVEKAIEMVEKN